MEENEFLFKRGNFFTGLLATPKFWNDIQEYVLNKEMLYNSLFHGVGVIPDIMDELKVSAVKKGGNFTIVVGRGVAIDKKGRALFLNQPDAKILDYKKYKLPQTVYITLKYNEIMDEYFQNKENPEYQGYQKKVESALVDISVNNPENSDAIELARIYLKEDENGEIKEILNPENITKPEDNEIDIRNILWVNMAKKGLSPYLKNILADLLDDTRMTALIANESAFLPGLRELEIVSVTAKMLVQCGNVTFDDIVNILSPIYDINSHLIEEIFDLERKEEKRLFSTKDEFSNLRNRIHKMGDEIKYYDRKIESLDSILNLQKSILDSLKNLIVSRKTSFSDIAVLSYDLPTLLVIDDIKYNLVDYIDFNDHSTEKTHKLLTTAAKEVSTSKHSFTYPDGENVKDAVIRYTDGKIKFEVNNIVKHRDLLCIRRSDIFHGNYHVDIEFCGKVLGRFNVDGYDTKNRWRNLSCIIDGEHIETNTAEMSFIMGANGRDNIGKIWIYQKL